MDTSALEEYLTRATGECSVLIKSFWWGKFLQTLPHDTLQACLQEPRNAPDISPSEMQLDFTSEIDEKLISLHIKDALQSLQACETSLSPNVFELITASIPCCLDNTSHDFLSHDYHTLNWPVVAAYLGKDVISKQDYFESAKKCGVIAKQVYERVTSLADLQGTLEQYSVWTHSPKTFVECLESLKTDNPLRAHLSLLVSSAALERALGDVYLTVGQATQCPPLLRDLLATEDLETIFGKTAMCLLRCLIGPPSGLNLRNVLWHGFPTCDEIPPEYAYLLLVVVLSLGRVLSERQTADIIHRPYIAFPQESIMAEVCGGIVQSLHDEVAAVEQLFSHSYFILPTMLPTWKAALQFFRERRFGHFVVLMLPAMEHGLRRVFACVNGCPERALTAESMILYTTLDEILNPVLPNGDTNCLRDEIGSCKLEMLLDLLVHPEGPRLRDRVSHGEVDLGSFSGLISAYLLCVVVVLCAQYTYHKDLKENACFVVNFRSRPRKVVAFMEISPHITPEERDLNPEKWLPLWRFHPISLLRRELPVIVKCLMVESQYVSLFHPISLLRRELQHLLSCLDQWQCIPKPDYWLDEATGCELYLPEVRHVLECLVHNDRPAVKPILQQVIQLFQAGAPSQTTPLLQLVSCVWERPLETLYVGRMDLELTGILRRMVENTTSAVIQVRETAVLRYQQSEQKQLRSRQRGNYDHLLASLKMYHAAVSLLVVMVTITASHLPLLEVHGSRKLIKFVKKLLQFSENLFSQTSPTKNRWEEADKLCRSLATLTAQLPLSSSPNDHHDV